MNAFVAVGGEPSVVGEEFLGGAFEVDESDANGIALGAGVGEVVAEAFLFFAEVGEGAKRAERCAFGVEGVLAGVVAGRGVAHFGEAGDVGG